MRGASNGFDPAAEGLVHRRVLALNSFATSTGPHACGPRTMKSATEVESWASLIAGPVCCFERTTLTHIGVSALDLGEE